MTRALEGRVNVQNDFTGKYPNTIESMVVKNMEYNDLQRNDLLKITLTDTAVLLIMIWCRVLFCP